MEKRLFLINKYNRLISGEDNHMPEEFKDGYISVKSPNEEDIYDSDFEEGGYLIQGINQIIKEGWTILSIGTNLRFGNKSVAIYAKKQEGQKKQQVVSLYFQRELTWRYDLKSFNQLLAKGWEIQDTFHLDDTLFFLLEFNQDDVICAEQEYLDKIRDIISEKGGLRTSDLIELTALREKLGISAERAEEIESLV